MLTFEDFPPGHFGTFGPRRVTREVDFEAELGVVIGATVRGG